MASTDILSRYDVVILTLVRRQTLWFSLLNALHHETLIHMLNYISNKFVCVCCSGGADDRASFHQFW